MGHVFNGKGRLMTRWMAGFFHRVCAPCVPTYYSRGRRDARKPGIALTNMKEAVQKLKEEWKSSGGTDQEQVTCTI